MENAYCGLQTVGILDGWYASVMLRSMIRMRRGVVYHFKAGRSNTTLSGYALGFRKVNGYFPPDLHHTFSYLHILTSRMTLPLL